MSDLFSAGFWSNLWALESREVHQRHQQTQKSLLQDNRGAVMLIGLFMATFLIGAMWFMKGVGDAMVFKDRMQESADHAVFSASAVNARGMNLIAVINIIMYVLVIIHCVIAVLKWAAIACSATVYGCIACCEIASALEEAETLYDETFIDIGLPALSIAGTAAAVGYPWYGSYAGFSVGSDYDSMVVAAGPSNVPGFSFSLPLGKLFGSGKAPAGGKLNMGGLLSQSGSAQNKPNGAKFSSDMKLGLPVILAENKGLCSRAVNSVASLVPGFLRWLVKWIGGLVTDCSGGVWEQKMFGWKQMYGAAENGNDWMQTWSFSFPHNYDEGNAESKVALAAGPTKSNLGLVGSLKGQAPSPPMYFAQSEMYFDCEKAWSAESCSAKDNAVFNMRWRARMRRVESPDFLGMIMGVIGQNLIGPLIDFGADALKNVLKGTKLARDASAVLAKAGKAIGGTSGGQKGAKALGGLLGADEFKLHNAVKNAVNNAIGSPTGTPDPGVLH
jgi:hypothetical protein